jgi:hypothetical protein
LVIFTGPVPNTKRDNIIGEYGGWGIERKIHPKPSCPTRELGMCHRKCFILTCESGIIMEENPDVVIPAPGFVPEGPLLPVEIVKKL